MSEKNNIFENDLLMRAILEGGQEEVPGRVWDAVADRLDKVDADRRKKTVTLWWRRAGVSVAAVAAAVASVVVLSRPESADFVPMVSGGDMIAVVEPVKEAVTDDSVVEEAVATVPKNTARLVAYVPERTVNIIPEEVPVKEEMVETVTSEPAESVMNDGPVEARPEEDFAAEEEKVYFPTTWDDDENHADRIRTSVVVSGITGASGSNSNSRNGILKAPTLITSPIKTGVTDKYTKSTFGLPVSVGAGVKIDFTPKWSLGVGLNYTYLTRTFNGTYTHVNEAGAVDNLVPSSDIRNSQHFIGIPVNAYYNIVNSKHVNFYAYAGGAVEKCVYDKYLVMTGSIVHKEPAKGVQLSANLGVGAEFMIGQHVGLYLDPSLRYYFDCDQPKSIRTLQPLMFGFELGFRFRL